MLLPHSRETPNVHSLKHHRGRMNATPKPFEIAIAAFAQAARSDAYRAAALNLAKHLQLIDYRWESIPFEDDCCKEWTLYFSTSRHSRVGGGQIEDLQLQAVELAGIVIPIEAFTFIQLEAFENAIEQHLFDLQHHVEFAEFP